MLRVDIEKNSGLTQQINYQIITHYKDSHQPSIAC